MNSENNHLLRWLLVIAVVMAIPILPFLGFGESVESRITTWLDTSLSHGSAAALVVGLLATDIFLPVPSSIVSTFAGTMLGSWVGTAASWCGMTLGAALAFGLVRMFGRTLASRLSTEEELGHMDGLVDRYGILILALMRPIPVLAEASVLLMGIMRLSWWRFLIAVGFSNFGIAAVYAALGNSVRLPIALAASVVIPLVISVLARWLWPLSTSTLSQPTTSSQKPLE